MLFKNVYDRLVNFNYRPAPNRYNDDMVRAEKTYVNKGIELPPKQIGDAMLVNDVHKNYFSLLRPRSPVNAVKGVSFSVKKGECFGLLGVNGAGKSTTFKMISGEECPTRGGVFANGHHLKWPRSQYLQSLGYCPQFFGLDEFLTGQENLSLLLTLRGLEEKDVQSETDSWIEVVGLERYRNTLVEGYSGGCMRRLATAAALSSGAPVTLLDEPTSGVDVSARRRVWVALRKGLRQNRAVIITSHSMDEMEALCDRIAIMSGGELGALGSACSLRAAYAAGHALVLKLGAQQRNTDVVDSAEPAITSLKEYLQQKFNCSLKDEHKTMLHYHINETMRYSELFSLLEQLKRQFPRLVEDYSVTETTLEEVFLSFAQPHPHPPAEPHPSNNQPV
ncbi:hypothetical protein O0L34_g7487 [Tuta absoluta]|nr:hypothetical protein O0L34_g7487 [Tuta absoluta]